jgi:hypothetical protein
MASHESDLIEVPPIHAMEDADWVHERSRWKCKINGCIDAYMAKWLFHQHLDNKHGLHMEVCKFGHPSIRVAWGTKAIKSPCYECSNFEQPTCKAKAK